MSETVCIGYFLWSNEDANIMSLKKSKISGTYWTSIKGEPIDPEVPEECWAITNKFDPAVRAGQQK